MSFKKVLIITYYWPPAGGSGVQRWLKFTKYLPKNKIFLLSLERFGKETGNENLIIKSIIKFDFVNFCRAKNINPNDEDSVLKLLAINFFKNEGRFDIQLVFDNNKIIELKSEIIECVLEDQNKKNLND